MVDLLRPEEREALQALASHAPLIHRASFPSVSELEPERIAALEVAVRRWLGGMAQSLSEPLRVACSHHAPRHQMVAPTRILPNDEVGFWVRCEPSEDDYLLIGLPRSFAASLCERVFGAPLSMRGDRPLTTVESSLLEGLAAQWVECLKLAWPERTFTLCPSVDGAVAPDRGVDVGWMRFSADVLCGPLQATLHLTLSASTARLILGEVRRRTAEPATPERIQARLGDMPLEIRAILGRASFSLDDLSALSPGDVITLDRGVDDPVDVLIGDRLFYRARAGLSGQNVALELQHPISKETLP